MLTEAEKRVARAAVSRFGVNHDQVEQAIQVVLQTRARGSPASLIDFLIAHKLLSQDQGQELRCSLDVTQIDPQSSPAQAKHTEAPAAPQANGSGEPPRQPGSDELRTLGEYRILRRLGEGGMGSVYLGYNEEQDRRVAIKVLPNRQATNQASVARFNREAESGALLNHPNIVARISDGQDRASGKHYLVLEYVEGPSAQVLLERFGRLAVGDAVHIVLDIAKALEHAHSRNIIHRDIKPGNILLTPSGVAKLADLGLAKRTDETSHLTAARQGFGTPYYMPYEQAMNAKSADARSDIYALGATLYHLLTGEVPFPGNNHLEIVDKKHVGIFAPARSINDKVPIELDDIIEKTLARDPRDRYQTASELIVDLERSGLSAPVPSFIDFDLAMADPLVRQRVTTPTQPTAPDLYLQDGSQAATPPELWFVRYRDRYGQPCKAKGTAGQIRRRLREGRFPAEALASRRLQGEYLPLNAFPEFQDAVEFQIKNNQKQAVPAEEVDVLAQTRGQSDAQPSQRWVIFGSAALVVLIAGVILLVLVTR